MSAKCKVCKDPRRADIEKAMSAPRSDLATSRNFSISRPTIAKHRAHIVHKVAIDLPKDPNSTEISTLKAVAQGIVDTTDDDKVRIAALRELRGYLELEARLLQETQGSSSLVSHAAFQQLAAALASTLCAECLSQVGAMTDDCLSVAATLSQVVESTEDSDAIPRGIPALE